jgi:hypothetical protein
LLHQVAIDVEPPPALASETTALVLANGGGIAAAEQARLLRLVAASDGARPSQIERAMDLPTELGLDGDTLLPTLALAVRAGRPLDPFKQSTAKFFGPDADRVLTAFSLLQTNADRAKVEEVIRGLNPVLRGHLFAPERPFLL